MKQLFTRNRIKVACVVVGLMWGFMSFAQLAEGVEQEPKLQVFTDAYTGELVISNAVEGAWQLQLFDLTGKEVFKQQIEAGTMMYRLDRSSLKKGIYLLRFTPAPAADAATIKVMLP